MKRVITTLATAAIIGLAAVGNSVAKAPPRAGQFCTHTHAKQVSYGHVGLKCIYRNGHYRLYHI